VVSVVRRPLEGAGYLIAENVAMAIPGTKWLLWLAVAAVLAVAGIGLWLGGMWYAHRMMPMSGPDMEQMPGMDMGQMPGMEMGGAKEKNGDSSEVPGYAQVTITPEMQQRIGVTLGHVEMGPLEMSVRTVGIVQPNETQVAHVHLKTEGWVEKLFVNFTGQTVQKGDPLLAIYSPDFLATQEEYLTARRAGSTPALGLADQSLAEAARRRLELLDVPPEEIQELEQTGKSQKNLTLRSPLTGTVLTKNAFEGMRVTPADELYVLGDLSLVWIQAKVYEYELPHVELGHPVKVTAPAVPGREFFGTVDFIEPTLDEETRTVQVRIELSNADGLLKPGMFAHVEITHTMGEGLLVPTSALLRTGERDIVFRPQPQHRFEPVEVKISPVKFGDRFQVLKGLEAGDKVVTSANFLIDSESRLRAGGGGMAGMPGMEMGEMKGMEMKGMDHSKMEQ